MYRVGALTEVMRVGNEHPFLETGSVDKEVELTRLRDARRVCLRGYLHSDVWPASTMC